MELKKLRDVLFRAADRGLAALLQSLFSSVAGAGSFGAPMSPFPLMLPNLEPMLFSSDGPLVGLNLLPIVHTSSLSAMLA